MTSNSRKQTTWSWILKNLPVVGPQIVTLFAAIIAIIVGLLQFFNLINAQNQIASVTLAILGTVTLIQALEIRKLLAIERSNEILAKIEKFIPEVQTEALRRELLYPTLQGLSRVHNRLHNEELVTRLCDREVKDVRILQTWIPNLDEIADELITALNNDAQVRILLLNPRSDIPDMRAVALRRGLTQTSKGTEPLVPIEENVQQNIIANLNKITYIYDSIDDPNKKSCLKLRAYDSLPSISMYTVDDYYLIGFYLHRRLAIRSPQLELTQLQLKRNQVPDLIACFDLEFETLWTVFGKDVNPGNPFPDLG